MKVTMKRYYSVPRVELMDVTPAGIIALSGGGDVNVGYGGSASENGLPPLDTKEFSWDCGEGQSSTEANPMHIYASAGTYTVRLTARGIVRTDVAEQTIVINPAA